MSDNNMESVVNNNSDSVSLDDAFNELATDWENLGTDPSSTEGAANGDSSENQETPAANEPNVSESESQPASSDTPSEDYKQLYENMLKERELQQSQMGLLYGRLNEISDKYQELKNSIDKKPAKEATIPAEVQELYEIYPDIAKAVEKMIEGKVSETKTSIEKSFEPRTNEVQEQIRQMASQNYLNQIMSVHPDVMQLAKSGALRNWVGKLDPLQRTGAEFVLQYGNAQDVINLISQYKTSVGKAAPVKNNTTGEDAIVKKVLAALATPSNKQEPSVSAPAGKTYASTEDAFNALAKEYEASHK